MVKKKAGCLQSKVRLITPPKLVDHPLLLSAAVYSIYAQLQSKAGGCRTQQTRQTVQTKDPLLS